VEFADQAPAQVVEEVLHKLATLIQLA
jgi:hypothetical protein